MESQSSIQCGLLYMALGKEAVPTQDNLIERGYTNYVPYVTYVERRQRQPSSLLHCKMTDHLWKIFINLKGIMRAMLREILEAITSWNKYGSSSSQKER